MTKRSSSTAEELQQQLSPEGEHRCLNSELWHACAGPLVSLPVAGSRVVYFPQGHSEQVSASTNREADAQIPNYPNLPPHLICQLHNVTMHADSETDEVYAQMTLQPLTVEEQKEPFLPIELGSPSKQPMNYFCKTLTASDTSTHGGFSVPRRAAEKVFPPLDFSAQPPAQELFAKDLHGNEWKFRHIFRGQPKRHLLTTGWSIFIGAKKLVAGDAVIFIWNESNQLLLGIRRSNRPPTVMPSAVLSSDSMHIGLLAAASHAASTFSRFTIFYNPRASPSEFVIPLAKYAKAVYHTRVKVGMRFRMLFETEESSVRRYMGTVTDISDLDPVRWPSSHWRSVKVGWDETTAGERQPRVSLWDVEPLTTFPMYQANLPLRLKRPWLAGLPSMYTMLPGGMSKEAQLLNFQGLGSSPWLLSGPLVDVKPQTYQAMAAAALQEMRAPESAKQSPASLPVQQPLSAAAPAAAAYLQSSQQRHWPSSLSVGPEQQTMVLQQVQQHGQLPPSSERMSVVALNLLGGSVSAIAPKDEHEGISPLHSVLLPMQSTAHLAAPEGWPSKRLATDAEVGAFAARTFYTSDPLQSKLGQQNYGLASFDIDQMMLHDRVSDQVGVGGGTNPPDISYLGSAVPDFQLQHPFLLSPALESTVSNGSNFVKVCRTGSVGRSLDIGRFSSYDELRAELGRVFGLEGLLEDPLRSGWQLAWIDRENDVTLLGDEPWRDFASSVTAIRILSPEDLQQMGSDGGGDSTYMEPSTDSRHGSDAGEYESQQQQQQSSFLAMPPLPPQHPWSF